MLSAVIGQVDVDADNIILWLTAAGIIIALVGILPNVRRALQATIWRRPALSQKLDGISTNMQLAYYEQLFGVGAFIEIAGDTKRTIWVKEDAYVLSVSDRHGRVLLYSITTRSRWFKPALFRGHTISLDGDTLEITLGKTRFCDLPQSPDGVQADMGAHTAHYDESYWYGNPGNYQVYVYSFNPAGYPYERWLDAFREMLREHPRGVFLGRFAPESVDPADLDHHVSSPTVQHARAQIPINTITVSEIPPEEAGFSAGFGPHEELMRLLHRPSWIDRLRGRWKMRQLRRELAGDAPGSEDGQ